MFFYTFLSSYHLSKLNILNIYYAYNIFTNGLYTATTRSCVDDDNGNTQVNQSINQLKTAPVWPGKAAGQWWCERRTSGATQCRAGTARRRSMQTRRAHNKQ